MTDSTVPSDHHDDMQGVRHNIRAAFWLYQDQPQQVKVSKWLESTPSFFNSVVEGVRQQRFDQLLEIYRDLLSKQVLELPHPLKPEVMTRAVASITLGSEHYIFFTNRSMKLCWVWMQRIHMMDAIILPAKIYTVMQSAYGHSARQQMKEVLSLLDHAQLYRYEQTKFAGLRIGHRRPHHFFYDQFRVLHVLLDQNCLPKDKKIYVDHGFYDVSSLGRAVSLVEESNQQQITLRPILYNAIGIPPIKNAWSKHTMRALEQRVYEHACSQPHPKYLPDADLKIWLGVTGQKRSWIEQITGYAHIIEQLRLSGLSIAVVLDGMTAAEGQVWACPEDQYVAMHIMQNISPDIPVLNLIGQSYQYKIQVCDEVDVFIANGGTGCMVPLRFCQKAGVVHSNTQLAFPFADHYAHVLLINQPEYVVDQASTDQAEQAMTISYHIQWQHLFNALLKVLPQDRWRERIQSIAEDQIPTDFVLLDTITVFKLMANRLFEQRIIAHPDRLLTVLRQFAQAFARIERIDIAYELTILALSKNYSNAELKQQSLMYEAQLGEVNFQAKPVDRSILYEAFAQMNWFKMKLLPQHTQAVIQEFALGLKQLGQSKLAQMVTTVSDEFEGFGTL